MRRDEGGRRLWRSEEGGGMKEERREDKLAK
jgi:hypothetical protein